MHLITAGRFILTTNISSEDLSGENTLNIKPWHIQIFEILDTTYYNKYKDGIYLKEKYKKAIWQK